MRGSCPEKEKKFYICDCPTCEPPERQKEGGKAKFPLVRKVKSTNIIHDNFDSVNIEIFQPLKDNSFPANLKSASISHSKSNTTLGSLVSRSPTRRGLNHGRNSYGIWRRCHDSANYRMPWSMANSHRDNKDKLAGSQIADGENKSKTEFDGRVFPFQSTPSGNLKIIPQQVVFESKKVSVLVADPRHTKVNIKAELAKQQALAVNSGAVENSVTKELKMMESEEARNVRKHQILSAITLMGGEARGAALSQLMSPGMPPGMGMPPLPKFKMNGQGQGTNDDSPYGGDIHDEQERDDRSIDSDDGPKPEVNLTKLGFMGSIPIDWTKVKLPQKTNLYKHMHYRITNYVNPDCIVHIDDVQFNCHLLVLQCYSAFFNDKTAKDVVKLPPENVSPKAFELIYEWMTYVHGDSYTILTRENILEVFLAAQFLGIKELEEQCWAFVDCEDLFREDTAFMLYLDAKKYGIPAIMELMVPRVMKFFLTLVSSKDFLELHLDEVHVLLSSNYISVHSEIEVFMSAVRWLWHDWKERKESLEQIMSCIRFGLIAPWQLVDIRRNPENPEFLEITSHPGVQQMIDNGLAYAIIKYWYGNQTEDYYHWIDLLGLSEPPSRNWAGEEKNYITYREFLHDLEVYRKEICYEREKCRSKRENAASTKSKRGNEQSGLTTSPRDTMQQQSDRRSSMKKHSPVSVRTTSLGPDTLRSEIAHCLFRVGSRLRIPGKEHSMNMHGDFRKNPFVPPTIWNINTMLQEGPMLKHSGTIDREHRWKDARASGDMGLNTPSAYHTYQMHEFHTTTKTSRKKGVHQTGSPRVPTASLNTPLRREHAAVSIIQRAYRSYKYRMRLRKQIQSKKPPAASPVLSGRSQTSIKHSSNHDKAKTNCENSASYPKTILMKDYLKDGSLFFADRESVIVFGGIDPHHKYGDGRNTGRNIFRYDSELNHWELVGELPQPRHHHSVAFLKGRIYLAGGTDPRDDEKGKSNVVGTVWSFEPITRSWYKETAMQTPRKNFQLVVMNGKLFAIGGQDKEGRILKSVERYDTATGVWEYIAPLNLERTGAAATKFRDTIWVAGGMTGSRKTPLTYTVESYDQKQNLWKHQAALRFPRCFSCLFAMNDVLYLIGGAGRASEKEGTTSSCNAVDVWDPKKETWKLHFAMSIPRHGHAVAYLGTQILIIGGVTTAYLRALTDTECFCCERRTWVKGLANLPVPLSGHSAVTLPPASLI